MTPWKGATCKPGKAPISIQRKMIGCHFGAFPQQGVRVLRESSTCTGLLEYCALIAAEDSLKQGGACSGRSANAA
jgi:hypothetical protein